MYIYNSLKNIAYRHDYKNGKVEIKPKVEDESYQRKVPFYNWVDKDDDMPY